MIFGIFKYTYKDRVFKFLRFLRTTSAVFCGDANFCFSDENPLICIGNYLVEHFYTI